jgi:hypothetical protein
VGPTGSIRFSTYQEAEGRFPSQAKWKRLVGQKRRGLAAGSRRAQLDWLVQRSNERYLFRPVGVVKPSYLLSVLVAGEVKSNLKNRMPPVSWSTDGSVWQCLFGTGMDRKEVHLEPWIR